MARVAAASRWSTDPGYRGRAPSHHPCRQPSIGCPLRWAGRLRSRAATRDTGAYDEILVSDVGVHPERVAGNFGLAVSLNTLEHVTDLETAVKVIGGYLHPGGRLVALFADKLAAARDPQANAPRSGRPCFDQQTRTDKVPGRLRPLHLPRITTFARGLARRGDHALVLGRQLPQERPATAGTVRLV